MVKLLAGWCSILGGPLCERDELDQCPRVVWMLFDGAAEINELSERLWV